MSQKNLNSLNTELKEWFPEFDKILFETPNKGERAFLLRTSIGGYKIKAADLSDGTRLSLAYLTLAYLPNLPKIVAFEEPEKGIHPRLLKKYSGSDVCVWKIKNYLLHNKIDV